jgi:hypothetical protein
MKKNQGNGILSREPLKLTSPSGHQIRGEFVKVSNHSLFCIIHLDASTLFLILPMYRDGLYFLDRR